jgi:hypothetical protein
MFFKYIFNTFDAILAFTLFVNISLFIKLIQLFKYLIDSSYNSLVNLWNIGNNKKVNKDQIYVRINELYLK